jgi:hypothetical protein
MHFQAGTTDEEMTERAIFATGEVTDAATIADAVMAESEE